MSVHDVPYLHTDMKVPNWFRSYSMYIQNCFVTSVSNNKESQQRVRNATFSNPNDNHKKLHNIRFIQKLCYLTKQNFSVALMFCYKTLFINAG